MDEDGPRAAEEQDPEPGKSKTFIRLNDLSGNGGRSGPGDKDAGSGDSEVEGLPYPALAPVVFFYLSQESRPRSWCLREIRNKDSHKIWHIIQSVSRNNTTRLRL
ncbi:unnamed protein product, partial [Lepidochelys kempii]